MFLSLPLALVFWHPHSLFLFSSASKIYPFLISKNIKFWVSRWYENVMKSHVWKGSSGGMSAKKKKNPFSSSHSHLHSTSQYFKPFENTLDLELDQLLNLKLSLPWDTCINIIMHADLIPNYYKLTVEFDSNDYYNIIRNALSLKHSCISIHSTFMH